MNQNEGHGHVFPRPDGMKARCGGPALCGQCSRDAVRKAIAESEKVEAVHSLQKIKEIVAGNGTPGEKLGEIAIVVGAATRG